MDNKNIIFNRIVIDPKIMTGKPVIRETRLMVQHIIGLLAQGMTAKEIIAEYTNVTAEDIRACLDF